MVQGTGAGAQIPDRMPGLGPQQGQGGGTHGGLGQQAVLVPQFGGQQAGMRTAHLARGRQQHGTDSPEEGRGGFFGLGEPNDAYAKYFTGQSYLKILSKKGDPLTICNVTFEPGCRNFWHIHHAKQGGGQVIICVDGEGWYQEEGKAPQSLTPGDIVEIPAGVKHWHGAKRASWFSHLAFEIPGTETSNEWCEPVTDDAYPQD